MWYYSLASIIALIGTLLIAYVIHSTRYPQMSGELKAVDQVWRYRIGRIPFINAGRFYLWAFGAWNPVNKVDVTSLAAMSTKPVTITDKSLGQHMLDCGLNYPAVYFYLWFITHYLLTGAVA